VVNCMAREENEKTVLLGEIESLRKKVRELEAFRDLRGNAEEALRKEEFYFDLFSATEEVAYLMDREGVILVANENAARLYGVPVERLSGRSIYELIPGDRVESSKKKVRTVVETRSTVRFEGKLRGKIFENSLYPVLREGPEVRKIAVYVRDITERKRLEEILRQTEEKYRNIYENAMEGIFQISPEGRFISANPSLALIHGYDSPEDLIRGIQDLPGIFVNPEDHARLIDLLFEEGAVQNYEVQMHRKDGSRHWILINVRVVRDAEGKTRYFEGTMRDITKRKRTESALSESEERYRAAIEHSNDAVALIEGDKTQYVNRKFVEMFGYELPEEVIDKPIFIIVHPDDRDRVRTINQRRQGGQSVPRRYEFKGITKAGKIIFIEVSATSILYRGKPVYLIYLRDMTERIQAHETLMKSHEELERLNRAKTKAVHHISHELKTPLAVIQGNIRILRRRLEGLPIQQVLTEIMTSLDRNLARLFDISKETNEIFKISQELEAGILQDNLERLWQRIEDLSEIPPSVRSHLDAVKTWLSQYLSGNTEAFQSIDLFPYVLQVLEKVKASSAHRHIRFQAEGEEGLVIFMDPLILENVLEGLLRNAVENTPDGGTIHLKTERRHDKIQLHVEDHGVGIREEDQAYIFDGLFHTKETDRYASKKPYDFGAGGKGLDLLRMKVYGQRFGFDLSVTGSRCLHILADQDECPGDIARCPHVKGEEDCNRSGGTTFTVSFEPKETAFTPSHVPSNPRIAPE
jgi:PAS domain S-box-containing protein